MSTAFELHIVFDCADPDRVARFWMAALRSRPVSTATPGVPGSTPKQTA
jgi:hypothetical protein